MENKIRVLAAKIGLDGHDRGIKIIAQALKDAGMEVIYTGIRQTPEQLVEIAIQEDVDVIGISILSGAHMQLLPMVMKLLRKEGVDNILVVGGGVSPQEDIVALKEYGIKEIFTSGMRTTELIKFIRENIMKRE